MQLKTITYSELEGTPQAWTLDELRLGNRTLLVGKNASGKSRALSVIYALSKNLAGLQPSAPSGTYKAVFGDEGKTYTYEVASEHGAVQSETLSIDGTKFLTRTAGGFGKIWAEKLGDGGAFLDFQTPTTEFAAVARRDSMQHSFFEPLFDWATNVRFFQFGTNLGKHNLAIFTPGGLKVDDRNQESIVAIFRDAKRDFGQGFVDCVKEDMASIGYPLRNIDIGPPISIRVTALQGEATPELMGLFVEEVSLPGITDQFGMSQGMFRVLSLLIHINYFKFKNLSSCLLVDDIGEGLDFDRACRLITLLRSKAGDSKLQIILSTNDKFVMNEVPLEEWSVLQRIGNRVSVKNITNSRLVFEEFKFSGLSNFSFFELDVANETPASRP